MKPLELLEQGRFLGEEFLLWLWMRSQTEGGASGEEGDISACFVDDAIQLASERGEVKEISLRKGSPAESREAFEALSRGMRPVKVKLRILSGDMEWVGTLDAGNLRLSALKMPPTCGKAPQDRLHDRLFLLEQGHEHLDRRFKRFLAERTHDQGEALAQALMAWVRAGLSGESMPAPNGHGFGCDCLECENERAAAASHTGPPAPAAPRSLMSEALDITAEAAQGVARDPGVRKAMGKLMAGLAEHGTTMTITTPRDGRSVTITPETAARASRALKGGGR